MTQPLSDNYVNEVVCPTCETICPFPNGTMMNLPLNNLACNIMIDLGLTDKILIRDQLIRILKQEMFRKIQSDSPDMSFLKKPPLSPNQLSISSNKKA